jgi:hypothetical protein
MDEGKDGRAETRVTHWARGLGEERHVRDERAAETAKSAEEHAARTSAVSAGRWPGIVAAIRRLVDAYNAGAGRAVLNVEGESDNPTVTIAAGRQGPSLTATLEDTLIGVRAHGTGGVCYASEVRLRPDRDNDATAAYVLQNWMQHL